MRCLIFPLSLLILMAVALQAEAASHRALRTLDSQTAVAKWLSRASEHIHRLLPPMSHGWAYEGDDKQSAAPSAAPTPAPVPANHSLSRASGDIHRLLPPMSHGWAFEGDDKQSAAPSSAPTPAPMPADKDAAVIVAAVEEEDAAVSSMVLLHDDDPIKEETSTALPADADKAPAVNSMPLLQEGSTPSSAVREHGWMRAQYSDDEQRIKDQQHRVLPPMSHGWANEGPGGGIVPGIGLKDEVGQARAEEDTVREAPVRGDKMVADMPPAAKDQP